ncbi:MAG: hypothetical protein ACK4VN_05220 [Bacteroidales bacterium]
MKTKGNILILLITLVACSFFMSACEKEDEDVMVKYEIITNQPEDTYIEWTNRYGAVNGGRLSKANWFVTDNVHYHALRLEKGNEIVFSGVNTNPHRELELKLYVNNKLVKTAKSDSGMKAEIRMKI